MTTALIIGVTGQDGSLLTDYLLNLGFSVHGTFRRGDPKKLWRLTELDVVNRLTLHECDLLNQLHLSQIIGQIKPDYIFHLASPSFVADSFNHPSASFTEITQIALNVLETLRYLKSDAWLFMAGSSEIYSGLQVYSINEEARPLPLSPYGVAKSSVQDLCRIYATNYGLKICHGILFNHESEYRSRNFVTRKITYNLARLALRQASFPLTLGNLDSQRDWSCARDFITSMTSLALSQCTGDFVLGSGNRTSLRQFALLSAQHAGFEPLCRGSGLNEEIFDSNTGQILVNVSLKYFRPYDKPGNVADTTKLHQSIDVVPFCSISDLSANMMSSDIARLTCAQ